MRSATKKVWLVVLITVLAVMGGCVWRAGRVLREANRLRLAIQDAGKAGGVIGKTAARQEFAPGFWQMALGENPVLVKTVQRNVAAALEENPGLAEGNVSMVVVTWRGGAEARDAAVHFLGEPAAMVKPVGEEQSAKQIHAMGKSWLTVLGGEIRIIADPDVEERQRRMVEAMGQGRNEALVEYLREPLDFAVVLPDPGQLFTSQYRSQLIAVLVRGRLSLTEARAEMVALGFDAARARAFAEFLGDTRMMMTGVARLKFDEGPMRILLRAVSRAQIRTEGPTVVVRGELPGELVEAGVPRLMKGLSKALRPAASKPAP